MAFVVPTGTLLGSVPGTEKQKQARPMPGRLGMAVDDSMNTAASAAGGAESCSRIGFLRKQGERSGNQLSRTALVPMFALDRIQPATGNAFGFRGACGVDCVLVPGTWYECCCCRYPERKGRM